MNASGVAVSAHVYLGVMARGASELYPVVESRETWKASIVAREKVGNPIPVKSFEEPMPRDCRLVIANPPCSRFSCGFTSYYARYEGDHFGDLSLFPELLQIVELYERAKRAEVLWWETGPLIRTKGLGMIASVHKRLCAKWTLIVATDPRWGGIPQARPRCHMIHCVNDAPVPTSGRATAWPTRELTSVGAWLDSEMTSRWNFDGDHHAVPHPMHLSTRTPELTTKKIFDYGTYAQGKPKLVFKDDPAVPTILSGRPFAWADEPNHPSRWWSAEEYAALTCAPPEWGRRLNEMRPGTMDAIMMLSKGVVGDVAKRVCADYVMPALAEKRLEWDGPRAVEVREGIWLVKQLAPEGPATGIKKMKERYAL